MGTEQIRLQVLGPNDKERDSADVQQLLHVYCLDDNNDMGEDLRIPVVAVIEALETAGFVVSTGNPREPDHGS